MKFFLLQNLVDLNRQIKAVSSWFLAVFLLGGVGIYLGLWVSLSDLPAG